MHKYYVNTNPQPNGDHEVHKDHVCPTPADPRNRRDLGYFSSCWEAVRAARRFYVTADGCANCSPECHRS